MIHNRIIPLYLYIQSCDTPWCLNFERVQYIPLRLWFQNFRQSNEEAILLKHECFVIHTFHKCWVVAGWWCIYKGAITPINLKIKIFDYFTWAMSPFIKWIIGIVSSSSFKLYFYFSNSYSNSKEDWCNEFKYSIPTHWSNWCINDAPMTPFPNPDPKS